MHILLVRHAKSAPDAGDGDFGRVLNRRGERDAPRMAQALVTTGVHVDHLWCSPATRTRQTAAAFIEALALDPGRVHHDERLYLADAATMLAVLRGTPACGTLMLVGHNPGLTDLANLLCPVPVTDNVPTAGIVHLEVPAAQAGDIREHAATLVGLLTPRALREARRRGVHRRR
jgi:phosphohistidine phosphatase